MKKVLCLLLVLVMAIGCAGISVSAAEYGTVLNNNVALMVGSTTAIANNALQTLPVAPTLVDGSVLIPLRAVSEFFNGVVNYDNATGIIEIRFGSEKQVVMRAGSTSYTLNGRGYTFAVAPQVVNDSTMVPLRALAQDIIGKTVFYDDATKLIVISSRAVLKDSVSDAAVISTIANAIASRNLPEISVPTSYELDWGEAEVTVGGLGNAGTTAAVSTVQATVENITASQEPQEENNAHMAFDGDIGTRWACENDGTIVADLGSVKTIVEIKLAWWKWDERTTKYDVEISSDGTNFTTIFSGDAKGYEMYETHEVNQSARYVRIGSHGNNSTTWNSLLECEIYIPGTASVQSSSSGSKLMQATGTKVSLNSSMVTATANPEPQNPVTSMVDGNSATYWAAENSQNAVIDLGSVMALSCVGVQMRAYDDGRMVNYGVEVSSDGSSYTTVFSGQCAAGGAVMEYMSVGASARYVRINVNGSTTNGWASVAEVEVYAADADSDEAVGSASFQNLNPVSGEFVIAVSGTTNVLTVDSDNFTLTLAPSAGNGRQLWTYENGNSIKNKETGYMMDVAGESYDEGGQICVWEGNGGVNQTWSLELDGDGYYIKSGMSGLYLSANGSSIQQRSKESATKWVIADPNSVVVSSDSSGVSGANSNTPTEISQPVEGEFRITVYGTNRVITLNENTSALSVVRNVSTDNQVWTMSSNSHGFVFQNKATGEVLDVPNQSTDEGIKLGVYESNDGANQAWVVEKVGNYYYIKNVNSGLYLASDEAGLRQRSFEYATKWALRPNN